MQSDLRRSAPVTSEVQPTSQNGRPVGPVVQRIAQEPKAVAAQSTARESEPVTQPVHAGAPAEDITSASLERPPGLSKPLRQLKELRTAARLAAMIEQDLAQHPEAPGKGLRVTVYGGMSQWRAMLTIMPAAGAVRHPQQLRDYTDQLAERLRQRYDLAWE